MAIGSSDQELPHGDLVEELEELPQSKLQDREDLMPSLKEMIASYSGGWVCIDGKYGHYSGIVPPPFHPQHFEDPAQVKREGSEEASFDGRQESGADKLEAAVAQMQLEGPLFHSFAPAFNWEEERASIPGLRARSSLYVTPTGLFSFSVEVVSLTMQVGLVEPISGTISLYHKDRREKISEDFHFSIAPDTWPKRPIDQQRRVFFTLDKPLAAVCLLIQLERTATEEDGVKASVYAKKDATSLSERDANRVAGWAASVPFKEPLAWTFIPIFDKTVTNGLGGFGLDTSQAPNPMSGVSTPRTPLNGFTGYGSNGNSAYGTPKASIDLTASGLSFSGTPTKRRSAADEGDTWQAVQVDVPMFHRVKAPYTEDSLQDQKKAQKAVRASMRLLIQRLSGSESSAARVATPLLMSGSATPQNLLGAPHRHRVHGPSMFASLDKPAENGVAKHVSTEAVWGVAAGDRKRRDSAGSVRTVLDGPESGRTTPLLRRQSRQSGGSEDVPRSSNGASPQHTPASSHGRADSGRYPDADADSTGGAPSTPGTDDWTVVAQTERATISGRVADTFLNRGVRSGGGLVRALDFRSLDRSAPYTELIHLLYVYPLSLQMSRKRNLLVRVELRDDDSHPDNPGMQVIFPKDFGGPMLRAATTQVAANTKTPLFHDEIKLRLPTVFQPQHHLVFTFLQPALRQKGKPENGMTVVGYSVLPLSMSTQVLRSDGSLPVVKELLPMYLNDYVKGDMEYLDDGRPIFRLRLRLCSTIHPTNERLQAFHVAYDRHMLSAGGPPSSALLTSINHLRSMDFVTLQQYLHPTLTMLLRLVGDGGETLQVASFRALVNILTRIQQESLDGSERNRILVHFIDYAFDDWRGDRHPAKGYKVGPVYEDVLSMAWVFLELITKSIALEANRAPTTPPSPAIVEDERLTSGHVPVLLNPDVFNCVRSLFECLLLEVAEKVRSGPAQARRLNTCLAYFCHDLLSVIDPLQVYELIACYMKKDTWPLSPAVADLRLTFLRIVCDHDKYVEFPGHAGNERNYIATLLQMEVLGAVVSEDPLIRSKAARLLTFIMCKHQFDVQSRDEDFREYAANLYLPLAEKVLQEPTLVTEQAPGLQRELLTCVLTVLEGLDAPLVTSLWHGKEHRARAFFQLLERALELFQWAPVPPGAQPGSSSPPGWGLSAHLFSEKLSPSVQHYITNAIRHHKKASLEQSFARQGIAHKAHLREALSQIQASRKTTPRVPQSREDLPAFLRERLDLWEGNLSARTSREVLRTVRLYSNHCTAERGSPSPPSEALLFPLLNAFLAKPQSVAVWALLAPLLETLLERHGGALLEPANGGCVKELAFHLLRVMTASLRAIRARAAACLLLLLSSIHRREGSLQSTRTLLSLTLSELLSSIQVLDSCSAPGAPPTEPPPESRAQVARLKALLEELVSREGCEKLLAEAGLSTGAVVGFEKERESPRESQPGADSGPAADAIDLYLPTVEAFQSEITPRGDGPEPLPRLLTSAPNGGILTGLHQLSVPESSPAGSGAETERNGTPSGDPPAEPSATTPSDLTAEDSFFSIFDSATPPLGTSPGGQPKADGWADVRELMRTLTRALESSVQHSLHVSQTATWHDPSESYARMAVAYSHVLELRVLWLLNLCEFHQGRQAWAEAAQCALTVAGVIMQALIHRGDPVWTPGDLAHLRRLCPSLPETLDDPGSRSSKISVDTALRYLQMAYRFCDKAALFHACTDLMELQLPAYKSRADYKQLAHAHEMLRGVYEAIREQEQDISFRDATYYRVGFYGAVFGPLDRSEFVYRESSAVRLGDMIERLSSSAPEGSPDHRIGIISDSRVVQNLPGGAAYLQITALEPVSALTDRPIDPPPGSPGSPNSQPPRHMGVSEFYCDTGFVKDGQTPGGLETQWKRRTVMSVAGSFPSLVRRLKVTRTAVTEITPIENAVGILADRAHALRVEIERPAPVLTSVQRLLQGSVALQVNSGVLGVCRAFLEPTRGLQGLLANLPAPPAVQDPGLERLKAAVLDFVAVCKAAVKVHARLMGDEDQEFHVQLVQGLQGLIFEISAFIPTVLNQM
ncbi:guanine nucleotide exchange factor [Klebsormidium nitens]|uniref:Guanine nucleotide exchange factor n=1 Tax=Klebsormidium nitens TaxID=105231 RepID=A0A0U9HRY0_KLENI|nr:guanine nucleotide exchange factor [Klebsormidium nitens]|eukprot:GAQ82020.1 guanine nucleotide exchange factor [Klebsormidium nitens]